MEGFDEGYSYFAKNAGVLSAAGPKEDRICADVAVAGGV